MSRTTRRYGFEIAHIVQDGLRRMYGPNSEDVFYYLTVYNEPIQHPAEPEDVDVEGILKGIHRFSAGDFGRPSRRRSWRPVSRCRGRVEAQRILAEEWNVTGRRLVGDLLERAAARGRRGGASTTCCTPRRSSGSRT